MEPVYSLLLWTFRGLAAIGGHKVMRVGSHRLPQQSGGVVAINHTSYLDFTYAAVEIWGSDHRRIRFMAKSELQDNKFVKWLMKSCRVIPVDRDAGSASYQEAVKVLRTGEFVGVYPEATIGRSFELKDFKKGAARMALEADVPIYPVIVWGAQRIVTKGYRNFGRTKTPVSIATGEPITPKGSPSDVTQKLHEAMQKLLLEVQGAYGQHPAGEFWVPARLGGGAMTLEEANEVDRKVAVQRAAERASKRNRH